MERERWATLPTNTIAKSCLLDWIVETQGYTVTELDTVGATDAELEERVADYLAEHMGEAPALVVACVMGRADDGPPIRKTTLLGSVLPGMWSFMLAARLRGLGTSWSSVHLFKEQEAAEVLGIPYDEVTQVCLTPVAYTKGTSFKPAMRPDPEEVIHWDRW